jgi:hypothetical protein
MRWWPGKRGGGSPWDGVDYLDLVPRRLVESEMPAAAAASDVAGDVATDRVVLLVPRYRDALWGRLVQPRLGPAKRYLRVPLEARGSALWQAIDGRRPVRDMLEVVAALESGEVADLPTRVCLYVQSLADNGFIALDRPEGLRGGSAET